MTINGYEVRLIVERIRNLQVNMYDLCEGLEDINLSKTPFGGYIGDYSVDTLVGNTTFEIDLDSNIIVWKFKDYSSGGWEIGLDGDVYEGKFDLRWMEDFDYEGEVKRYLEGLVKAAEGEIESSTYSIENNQNKVKKLNQIIGKIYQK